MGKSADRQREMQEAIARTEIINAGIRAENAARRAGKVAPKNHGYGDCHYCGMPATGFNFFDVPVCDECQ